MRDLAWGCAKNQRQGDLVVLLFCDSMRISSQQQTVTDLLSVLCVQLCAVQYFTLCKKVFYNKFEAKGYYAPWEH